MFGFALYYRHTLLKNKPMVHMFVKGIDDRLHNFMSGSLFFLALFRYRLHNVTEEPYLMMLFRRQ